MIPAAHYMMGGIVTDLVRALELARLYAVRRGLAHRRAWRKPAGVELAARGTRVRGARGARHDHAPTAQVLPEKKQWEAPPLVDRGAAQVAADDVRSVMWDHAGIARTAKGLRECLSSCSARSRSDCQSARQRKRTWFRRRDSIAEAALLRKESRGGHYRS